MQQQFELREQLEESKVGLGMTRQMWIRVVTTECDKTVPKSCEHHPEREIHPEMRTATGVLDS